ncbi:MAG: type II toxin-antitoxin system RatA family toxin [Mariprofundaceae bacterium]|nr:type II toxin-antitoxin system RatA family toxin [Mariprofundaceae bacterium]
MHGFEETKILSCSAEAMFDVVMDIEAYPEFLPWVSDAKILSKKNTELTAELIADFAGLKKSFSTTDRFVKNECVEIKLVDGPFRFLESFWSFEQISDVSCKVHFSIEFKFKNPLLAVVATPIFTTACKTMVHAFERRACAMKS